MSVKIGQAVVRQPKTIEALAKTDRGIGWTLERRPLRGRVVYIHPKGRFHVVEFENGLRESFEGVD